MELNADELLANALRDGIREVVKAKFTQSYQNPLEGVLSSAISQHSEALRLLVSDAIAGLLADDLFRQSVVDQVRSLLAKQLVHRFGGELEKQVNTLKSDPATRARITLAIEAIVKEKTTA